MQVVVIIVVSVVYFIVVLLSEVYMMLSAGRKQKAKGKGKRDAAKQRGFIDMTDATISADAGSLYTEGFVCRDSYVQTLTLQMQFVDKCVHGRCCSLIAQPRGFD